MAGKITGWITTDNGVHIPLLDGESKASAIKRFGQSHIQKSNTVNFRKMTRKELAAYIVDNQIKRGIVKPENRKKQIDARLKGHGAIKAESWTDLYNGAKAMQEPTKKYTKTKSDKKSNTKQTTKKSASKKSADTKDSKYATYKDGKLTYKGSNKKEKLVNEIAYQLNVKLSNNKSDSLNKKRNLLYTEITRVNKTNVLSYLRSKGYKYEEHMKDYYWIYL